MNDPSKPLPELTDPGIFYFQMSEIGDSKPSRPELCSQDARIRFEFVGVPVGRSRNISFPSIRAC